MKWECAGAVSVLPFGVQCTHILLFCVSLLRLGVGLITISSFCGSVGKHELCFEDAITLPSSYDMIREREGGGESRCRDIQKGLK